MGHPCSTSAEVTLTLPTRRHLPSVFICGGVCCAGGCQGVVRRPQQLNILLQQLLVQMCVPAGTEDCGWKQAV